MFVAELISSGLLVNNSCLNAHPGVNGGHYIVPPNDVGLQNLTGTGVKNRWSHSISLVGCHIGYHRITRIVYLKVTVFSGDFFCNNGVFKSGCFESFLPVINSINNVFYPLRWGGRIDVKYNRTYRFCKFSAGVCLFVFRLQSPTCYQVLFFQFVLPVIKIPTGCGKVTHSRIFETGSHRCFR